MGEACHLAAQKPTSTMELMIILTRPAYDRVLVAISNGNKLAFLLLLTECEVQNERIPIARVMGTYTIVVNHG